MTAIVEATTQQNYKNSLQLLFQSLLLQGAVVWRLFPTCRYHYIVKKQNYHLSSHKPFPYWSNI